MLQTLSQITYILVYFLQYVITVRPGLQNAVQCLFHIRSLHCCTSLISCVPSYVEVVKSVWFRVQRFCVTIKTYIIDRSWFKCNTWPAFHKMSHVRFYVHLHELINKCDFSMPQPINDMLFTVLNLPIPEWCSLLVVLNLFIETFWLNV